MSEERIKLAAAELSAALTEAGGDYSISLARSDVTRFGEVYSRYAYVVHISETRDRMIAP